MQESKEPRSLLGRNKRSVCHADNERRRVKGNWDIVRYMIVSTRANRDDRVRTGAVRRHS